MEREIKFEYGFNSVNGIVKKKYFLHEIPFMDDKCDVWQMLPVVYVRQFTGLKDKNGIEIYDGDIIKGITYSGHLNINTVIYDSNYGCYQLKSINENPLITPIKSFNKTLEVIGNIYENQEL